MRPLRQLSALACLAAALPTAAAQQPCREGSAHASGEVLDSTGAAIVGASVTLDAGSSATAVTLHTGRDGHFITPCLPAGDHEAVVFAAGFETLSLPLTSAHPLTVRLKPFTETTVEATAETVGVDSDDVAGSKTLTTSDVKQLADDPDEFARQLQVLAAAAGGAPGQALVTVDGFQNGGRIPPKSAIAYVRINPDLFSAEYARPPYQGGRIEIYTKPGQGALHGALFTTQSAGFLNARDPFATSRAAIGKQRYGFELSGPLKTRKADFSLALEHREIDQFAVVNAVTLDPNGAAASTVYNVATPQALWEGSARVGVLLSPRNNFTAAYTAGVSGLTNVGVGGTSLQEAGYSSLQSEHAVRLSNLQTLSPNLLHESRVGYTWRYRTDRPNSTAPSLQVAGAFTGGGVSTGYLAAHERDLEIDDDVLFTHGKHNLKAGVQLLDLSLHNTLPTNFNGSYIFGGGLAPSLDPAAPGTITISGLEQYRRALMRLPGGAPTQFNVNTGNTVLSLNQLQAVFYVQDQWKLRPRLQLSLGVRWALQSAPTTVGNAGPRLGLAWSPDRKQKTVFHLRSGLFYSVIDAQTTLTAERLDGVNQRQLQIYSPAYGSPLTTGSATITTLRAPLPNLSQTPSLQSHLGVEHEFPGHWHAQANLYLVHAWDVLRSRNINAPTDGTPTGPRPLLANTNLDQYQQSGNLGGNVLFLGLDQHSLRRLQIFAGYIRLGLRGNADTDSFFPQNSLSNAGERARPLWEATHQGLVFSSLQLPRAVSLSIQFNAASGVPYNVTTGFDNNGDGVFNDRPFYTPAANAPVYSTRFGSLAASGTGPTIGRNAGTLPWNVHFDANLSRSFSLPHKPGREGQTLGLNLRSTNLLNHTNITAVGGVLGSPLFGQGYAADPGRRLEAGLRWAF